MKNKKGFTLIELLAVVVVIGLLVAIAFPAVSKYTNETRNDAYSLHEAELKTATANMMSKCVQGDVEGCVPDSGGSRTVYLNELIAQKYSKAIKDPAKSNSYCDADKTYVVVTNTKNNVVDLEYQVCLVCSKYQSAVCETVTPDNKCDKTTDPDRPACGDAIGSSTIWTNSDRVISIGCSDTGCGCTQGTYYQRFEETAKQGVMTIVDKAGNTTDCVVDVYVDKEVPKCELEVVGTQGEHGWYGGTAPVVKFKTDPSKIKDTSGIATYGIGLSSKNPNLNKETSYTVSPGITTVYGYVKDNAGNVGMCKAEVKYDNVVPTSEITYGYRVYPKSDIATTSGQYINLNSFIKEYGNVLGANIYLKSNSGGMSVTIYKGSTEIAKRTISAGVKSMKFTFSGTYDSLKIDMGSASNIALVDRIELITDHTSGFYTNKDIYVYATSHDSFSGKGYYSFDGEAWQESNRKTYTANVFAADARTKDYAGNISKKIEFTVNNIDKDKPKCTVTTDKAPDGKNNWFISNFGLTLNRWDNQYVTGTNVISEVRDYNITTSTTPSYTTTYKATQTQDTKLTTWHGYIRDRAGNVNTCSIDVKLDKVDPVCNVYPTKEADGENGWYISTVDIKFTEKDDTAGVVFRDLTKSATPSYNMNTQLTLDYDTKGQMFYCYVEDEAGRTGSNKNSYKRDTVDPSCEITPDRNPDGLNNWYLSDVRLTLTTKSDTSPITGYDLTTSTTVNYTGKRTTADITKSTNSVTYHAYTKEESGRINTCYRTIKIDEHNPTCTVTPSGTKGDNGWYVSNITMTLAYDDNETGVATGSGVKKYDVINSNVAKPSSYANKTVNTHTADGTGIIYYGYVQDDAGRTGKCSSDEVAGTVKKDNTKPNSCSINVSKNPDGDNGWYRSNVNLTLAATPGDNLSGVVAYEITSGTPGYTGKTSSYNVTKDSTSSSGTTYTAYIKDAAGNVQSCSKVIKRDTYTDCSFNVSGTPGLSGWYTSAVTVTLNRSDWETVSGVASYGVTNSYGVNYNSVASGSASGYVPYKIFYGYIKDKAGNTNWCVRSVKVDQYKPTCTVAVTSGTKGSNNWYTSNVTVGMTVGTNENSQSGILNKGLSTNSYATYNNITSLTRYANTSSSGVKYSCYVMDRAGNVGTNSITIKKDDWVYCYVSASGTRGDNNWYTSNVTLSTKPTDSNSGINSKALNKSSSLSFTNISGASVSDGKITYTHTTETDYVTYYCHVKDNAGNTYTNNRKIRKDSVAPTCSLKAKSAGSWFFGLGGTDWTTTSQTFTKEGDVTIGWNSKSDTTSGIVAYGLTTSSEADYNSTDEIELVDDTVNRITYYGYVKDEAGLTGKCSRSWGRDTQEPACDIKVTSGTLGGSKWYRSSVNVSFTAYDENKNAISWNSDKMTFTGGSYSSSTKRYASSQGTTTFKGSYTFPAGFLNLGSETANCSLEVKIDTVAPTLSVSTSKASSKTNPSSTAVTVYLSGSDSTSGINYWYYKKSGASYWSFISGSKGKTSLTLTIDDEGDNSRYFKVCDVAGNCKETSSATSIWVDYSCAHVPAGVTGTWGACKAACGASTKEKTTTWTGDTGATCKKTEPEDCENYDNCKNAHNLCKNNSDSALFGSSIASSRANSMNNYGSWSNDMGAFTCNRCSNPITVYSGYHRVCNQNICSTYGALGKTADALHNEEASFLAGLRQDIADGKISSSDVDLTTYCKASDGWRFWCSCNSADARQPFVHKVLSLNGTCSWMTEEDKAYDRSGLCS